MIVYITTNYLKLSKKAHSAWIDSNGSSITVMLCELSSELNTCFKVDTDICSTVSAGNAETSTREQLICAKGISDVMSRAINYAEMAGLAPQNRVDTVPAHLYQDIFAHIQLSLKKDMREEHAKAMNYNLHTGRVRRYY